MTVRMRKLKHGDDRFDAVKDYFLDTGMGVIGDPLAKVPTPCEKVYLEVGAGKGGFAVGMAKMHPRVAFFAMERNTDCMILAGERAKEAFPDPERCNLRYINETADNLTGILTPETVDGLFLNFSDPWPKKGYAKRRLVHRRYLAVFFSLLKDGGTLQFKTDNDGLFDFALEEFEAIGLPLEVMTRDLHHSEYTEGNVMTEYETAFVEKGKSINLLRVKKPTGFSLPIPEDLLPDRKRYGKAAEKWGNEEQ